MSTVVAMLKMLHDFDAALFSVIIDSLYDWAQGATCSPSTNNFGQVPKRGTGIIKLTGKSLPSML